MPTAGAGSLCMRQRCNTRGAFWRSLMQVYVISIVISLNLQKHYFLMRIPRSASPQGSGQCRTLRGETPLFLAVVHGLRENATFLLQNGCDPDCKNEDDDSALVAGVEHSAIFSILSKHTFKIRTTRHSFLDKDLSRIVVLIHVLLVNRILRFSIFL